MIHPLAHGLAGLARLVSGVQVAVRASLPSDGQRIVFANHTSHLDAIVLWAALPPEARARRGRSPRATTGRAGAFVRISPSASSARS